MDSTNIENTPPLNLKFCSSHIAGKVNQFLKSFTKRYNFVKQT